MAIDRAIAAAQEPKPIKMAGLEIVMRSGRKIGLQVPVDLNPQEALDLVGYITGQGLAADLAKLRGPASKLVVPSGIPMVRG